VRKYRYGESKKTCISRISFLNKRERRYLVILSLFLAKKEFDDAIWSSHGYWISSTTSFSRVTVSKNTTSKNTIETF